MSVSNVKQNIQRQGTNVEPSSPISPERVKRRSQELELAQMQAETDFRSTHPYPTLLLIVHNGIFELFIALSILFNCVIIGVQADQMKEETQWITIAGHAMTGVFLVEIVLRILVYGYQRVILKSVWHFFDFLIVLLTSFIVMCVLIWPALALSSYRFVQVLRILRITKVLQVVRALPMFKTAWLLIKGITESASTLLWSTGIGLFTVFIFGVFATVMIGQDDVWDGTDPVKSEWFASVSASMFTMAQIMLLDDAFEIIQHVDSKQPGMWLLFVLFIGLSSLCFLNLITAVILEQVMEIVRTDEESQLADMEARDLHVRLMLRDIFINIPRRDPDVITKDEFRNAFKDEATKAPLLALDFEEENAEDLFMILDADKSGSADVHEFTDGMLRMRGAARSKDLYMVTNKLNEASSKVATIHHKIRSMDQTMSLAQRAIQNIFTAIQDTHELLPVALARSQGKSNSPQKRSATNNLFALRPMTGDSDRFDQNADNALVPLEDPPFVKLDTPRSPGPDIWAVDSVARANVTFVLLRAALGGATQGVLDPKECIAQLHSAGCNYKDAANVVAGIGTLRMQKITILQLCHEMATEASLQCPGPAFVRVKAILVARAFQALNVDAGKKLDAEGFAKCLATFGIGRDDALEVFRTLDAQRAGRLMPGEIMRRLSLQGDAWAPTYLISVRHRLLLEGIRNVYGGGKIPHMLSPQELEHMLESLGLGDFQAQQLIKDLGGKDLGFVSCVEFCHVACLGDDGVGAAFMPLHIANLAGLLRDTGVNGEVYLHAEDFVAVLQSLGVRRVAAQRIFTALDVPHRGVVPLSALLTDFLRLSSPQGASASVSINYALLMSALHNNDTTGDKKLAPSQFVQMMKRLRVGPIESMRMFTAIDEDQVGSISVQEVCSTVALWQSSEQAVKIRWMCFQAALALSDEEAQPHEMIIQKLMELGARLVDATALVGAVAESMNEVGRGKAVLELKQVLHTVSTFDADPRVLLRIRYMLIRAVFNHFSLDFESSLGSEEFINVCIHLGVRQEDAMSVFLELHRITLLAVPSSMGAVVSVGDWCHTLTAKSGNWTANDQLMVAYRSVRSAMFGACFDALGVAPERQLDVTELFTVLAKAGVTQKDSMIAFLASDTSHTCAMTLQQFIDILAR